MMKPAVETGQRTHGRNREKNPETNMPLSSAGRGAAVRRSRARAGRSASPPPRSDGRTSYKTFCPRPALPAPGPYPGGPHPVWPRPDRPGPDYSRPPAPPHLPGLHPDPGFQRPPAPRPPLLFPGMRPQPGYPPHHPGRPFPDRPRPDRPMPPRPPHMPGFRPDPGFQRPPAPRPPLHFPGMRPQQRPGGGVYLYRPPER